MSRDVKSAYLAAVDFEKQLEQELEGVVDRRERLFLSDQPAKPASWAQNIWRNPQVHAIDSINHAARILKSVQRNWCLYSTSHHRRSTLIQEKLPHVSAKPLVFPATLPKAPLGSWTLLDQNLLLASAECSSSFANGEVAFEENRTGPPNRAYLKLWEALTLMEARPQQGEFCIDAGGSPGGWAWVLAQTGADVFCVDRAPLDERVMKLKNIDFEQGNAFNLKPEDFDFVDWLCCDVICYPEKLLGWITPWVESGKVRHMVVTLKFQGEADYAVAHRFAEIPDSHLRHLYHNRHELTWMWKRSAD